MKPIILEYRDSSSLVDGTIYYGGLVIAAQSQMASIYRQNHRLSYDATSLLRALLSDWYSPIRLLRQHILLSQLIDKEKSHFTNDTWSAFKKNKAELVQSFRTLQEIGIEPSDLVADSEEYLLFRLLYNLFIEDDESGVKKLRWQLNQWENPENFRQILSTCVVDEKRGPIGSQRAVYFQGFYYIRPMQKRLIDSILKLEIPVFFLNAFDETSPFDYEVWLKNPYFSNISQVRKVDEDKPIANNKNENKVIYKFDDIFAMVRYLRHAEKKVFPVAPMSIEVQELLETFFQKTEEKENLLAYPIGRYLWGLYDMWDEERQSLILNEDIVKQCLSTGWASQYCEYGKLLDIFNRVHDFFSDCQLIEEWQERLTRLKDITEQILPLFDSNKSENFDQRWEKIISTPFSTIGAFNATPNQVQQLVRTIEQMIVDAKFLFGNGKNSIDLGGHFKTIQSLISQKINSVQIRNEEKQIIDKFERRLNWKSEDLCECPPSHLAEAMSFFLGGKTEELDVQTEEIQQIGQIRSLAAIEAVHLAHPHEEILLCCCDANSLPGSPKKYSWPFSFHYLSNLSLNKREDERLKDYLYFMESTVLSNRFLFHQAQSHLNLGLSWVVNDKDKENSPSIYLRLLESFVDCEKSINGLLLDNVGAESSKKAFSIADYADLINAYLPDDGTLPIEVKCDNQLCPEKWRLVYDYGVANHPYYTSAFHMQFLMSFFIAMVADSMGCEVDKAAKEVFSIYPSFSESMRQQIINFAQRQKYKLLSVMDRDALDSGYTKRRLYLNYLNRKITDSLLRESDEDLDNVCVYCPHSSYCCGRH